MSVFAIAKDITKFKEFSLSTRKISSIAPEELGTMEIYQFYSHNTRMSTWWEPLSAKFITPEGLEGLIIPDVTTWVGSTLILSTKAKKLLEKLLSPFGEILPIEVEGLDYYWLFNCFTEARIDEINSKNKKNSTGDTLWPNNIAFNSVDIESKAVFKTPFDNCTTLFCQDELKHLIQKNELNGVLFGEGVVFD